MSLESGHPCLLGHLSPNVKKVIDLPATYTGSSRRLGQPSRIRDRVPEAEAALADPDVGPWRLRDILEDRKAPLQSMVEASYFTIKNWGARHANEDRWVSEHDVYAPHALQFHTIGVLDGHDSDLASDLVARGLPGRVASLLQADMPVVEAYGAALSQLEDSLKEVNTTAGTCVLSCTVVGRFVWCANLGDCRAGLFLLQVPPLPTDGSDSPPPGKPKVTSVHWLSRDHKAGAPCERRRISELGGTVIDGRVEGLEPSRTLGDFDVKAVTKPGVISIVPEVRRYELGADGYTAQAILVCATDGVWDTVSGQDICSLIGMHKAISEMQSAALVGARCDRATLRELAQDIVQLGIAKGSRDDCTCVVSMISVLQDDGDLAAL